MRSEARHSPEAEHTVWWLLLCRAAERAARVAEREAMIAEADATVDKLRALHKHTMGYEDACVARGADCELDEIAEAIRGLAPPAAQSEQDVDDAMVERACIAYSEATYGQCTETRREAMIRSGAMHAALLAALGGKR